MMPQYYFDLREVDGLVVDEEGLELRNVQTAQEEAARSMADVVQDELRKPAALSQQLVIEVRDDAGPVMKLRLTFEIEKHN